MAVEMGSLKNIVGQVFRACGKCKEKKLLFVKASMISNGMRLSVCKRRVYSERGSATEEGLKVGEGGNEKKKDSKPKFKVKGGKMRGRIKASNFLISLL
jgi:hypothetical protein